MSKPVIEPGTQLLHYRLTERLGAGGMAVVWKAVDTVLDREVAIKILPDAFASDAERLARFEREAKLLASLNHPNVAGIYGLHESEGVRFLAMELVRGRTLTDEIADGLSPTRTIELATSIADGLAAAHRQRVVHRDLKPDNIMIDPDGRPKILDFGLAKVRPLEAVSDSSASGATALREATTTREGTLLGTVAYMSPEQAQGLPVDARSDIFSLGIVLYEMATGQRPFTGASPISILSAILRDTPPPVSRLAPSAPPPVDAIVARCLEKDPAARYPDASTLRDDLQALRSDPGSQIRPLPVARRRSMGRWLTAAIAVLAIAAAGLYFAQRQSRQRWVRATAIPQLAAISDRIQGLEEGRESWDAYRLARQIEETAPGDPLVEQLRGKFSRRVTITSNPPGATVSVRYYDEPDSEPLIIGQTPLEDVNFPRGFTHLRLELPGRQRVDDVVWNFSVLGEIWHYDLPAQSEVPPDMSLVPAGAFGMFLPGLDHLDAEEIGAFLIDRHEVSNRDYKRFVDAGGYREPAHWRELLATQPNRSLQEAVAPFVDRTGRTGPSTWEVGSYPDGQADYPVSGVSWYEAAAYAAWSGKSLPTVFHWNRVAFTPASSRIIPTANLSGKGPLPVGRNKSANRFGVFDMAGNVREWVWNTAEQGQARYILGGGWNDEEWAFSDAYAQPPMDRSATNGFRCIKVLGTDPKLADLQRPLNREFRDFFKEKPVSDQIFEQYLAQYRYDRTPLNARVEERKQAAFGTRERITFPAAYGGEEMMAYLFLPSGGKPPYQVVIAFPGSGSIETRSSASLELGRIDFLQRSGRAVIWPIYKGTYERGGDLRSSYPSPTSTYKDYVIMWGKDLKRSIDYVETRPDLDSSRIAYYGTSWGGKMGAILPAIEPRIKVNVLYVAGLNFQRALPEVDQINYITRVKQPTLILNGERDFFFPAETSQKPMFELLGTPPEHKKRLVFPGGHSVPRTEMIRESLQWLDRYLGPVGQ
jgi:serine/threonine protein kinase/dienelactone hydrolase